MPSFERRSRWILAGVAAALIASGLDRESRAGRAERERSVAVRRLAVAGSCGIDLNRAPASDIGAIPGAGAALGRRIVAWRELIRPFRHREDLSLVPGIGKNRSTALRPFVRAGPEPAWNR